jgi:hypothetical protein
MASGSGRNGEATSVEVHVTIAVSQLVIVANAPVVLNVVCEACR